MNQFIWNYLGFGETSPPKEQSTTRGLPASWYRSKNMYDLERRAVFSKRWLLVTHRLRFPNIGDWVRYKEAGFEFFVVRDRQGEIKAFHNVCRHRAFPIVTEAQGTAKIFSCQYHGWSYGLNGNLAKAPGYQDMDNFDKTTNGLFPVHVHVDDKGFVWVNLQALKPEIPWSEDFDGVDIQERFGDFNFEEYRFDHTWNMSGDYNWKTLAENYNECYHCSTAHPDAAAVADLSIYSVDTKGGHIQHFAHPKPDQIATGMKIASTFYFPNACMTVAPHFFYMMRCVPTAENHSSMEYEVYRHKDADDEGFERIDSMFKRILSEDKWLCNNAQKNLEAGVFVNGEMHPRMEKGPLFFQKKVRNLVQTHWKQERGLGGQIWPTQQALPVDAKASRDDEEFCERIDCQNNGKVPSW